MKKPKLKLARANRKENPEAVMSIGDHLRELRDRIIVSVLAMAVGAVVGWFLFDHLFALVTAPIEQANAAGAHLSANFGTILSSFDLRMRLSIWCGVIITSPIWLYQFFAYVGPGMTRKEKAYTAAFGFAGIALFTAGCALGVWVMPHAVKILTGFIPKLTSTTGVIDVSVYLSFYLRLVLVFGCAFLLPEVMVALNRLGLMKGTTMLKGWRWAVVGIFAFMAVANPLPDPWSMIFMALPITALYFIACGMSIYHDKRMAKKRAKEEAELDAALAETPAPATELLPASATAQIEPVTSAQAPAQIETSEAAPALDATAAPVAELPATQEAPEPATDSED